MDAADIHCADFYHSGFTARSGDISNEPFITAQHTFHVSHAELVDRIGTSADMLTLDLAPGKRGVNPVVIRWA
ncbi:hypothetical protein D3C87_1974580 [compost metagenome]